MTTRSPQTQSLSQATRSGPRADSIIAMPPPPPPPTHKTFLSEIRLKSLQEGDYKHSGKFQETCENFFLHGEAKKA